jgi:G3E family GTPase
LPNGCFCCRRRAEITETLADLFDKRRRGTVGDFDCVLVETSGLADPTGILLALAADSELATLFYAHSVLTVVDAVQAREILQVHEEARRQLVLADLIALTKADLAGFDETAAVRELVGAANALAPIVDTPHGSIDGRAIFARQWFPHLRSKEAKPSPHGPDLMCHTLRRLEPLPWPAFSLAMETLAALRGPDQSAPSSSLTAFAAA